jgi:hypothetical protein
MHCGSDKDFVIHLADCTVLDTDDHFDWLQITDLPWSIYSTFVIEQVHGFNKVSGKHLNQRDS